MKTLVEEIAAIKEAKMSRPAKKQALMKLGITNNECAMILATLPKAERVAAFTFGVEIECGVERGALRSAAAATGLRYEYEGYNHRDGHAYFKFVHDGSLSGMCGNEIECVSPILKGADGKKTLKQVCETLAAARVQVNRSCGLHVHIGAAHLTQEQYANVFINYRHLEAVIDSFMAESRRGDNNYYCASLQDHHRLDHCVTRDQVACELRHDRYHKVNPISYERHQTIEFRQHQGTANYAKILNWVMFCGKLVEWSKKHRLTSDVTSIDDIEFLNAKEKSFFKARAAEFAACAAA